MADYTPLGLEKIARQAGRDLSLIRCPRDSVVMRVVASRAGRVDGVKSEVREFRSRPPHAEWRVSELTVECPACRRVATGIRPDPGSVPPAPITSRPAFDTARASQRA
ncbi:MAG: hypothetical protein OEO20_03490 [Gemmatimonadota bacterium]|nr:hypothetical protein [Gemmatimonadota bacterium]MDH3369166.1 hypothetical protein [Gemmatimonadota bacterium]MDH3477348.1 hypothetical protein [Gemmatimonadota bacterium]MDH3570134.1 hypothetical protein [Gemmatimonadota bacterium]MDH5549664.1 hypothetical protein [Gemmatimonadota bacterium]